MSLSMGGEEGKRVRGNEWRLRWLRAARLVVQRS